MSTPTTAPTLRPVSITVTAERIAAGTRNACDECPVSLAVSDVLRDGYRANVTGYSLIIYGDASENAYVVTLPRDAFLWIDGYDAGETVAPFAFTVELPVDVLAQPPT